MLLLQMHVRLQLLQTSLLDGSTAEPGGLLTAQLGKGNEAAATGLLHVASRRGGTGASNRGQRHGTGMDLRDNNEGGTP